MCDDARQCAAMRVASWTRVGVVDARAGAKVRRGRRLRCVGRVDASVDARAGERARDEWSIERRSVGRSIARALMTCALAVSPLACDAREFFSASPAVEEPVEPFTVYGTVEKLFEVRVFDDEAGTKVVGRKRGITAKSCVNVIPASRIPMGGRAPVPDRPSACAETAVVGEIKEQRDMLRACAPSCSASCSKAVGEYAEAQKRDTGFGLPKEAKERVVRSCVVTCGKDCERAGKSYSFEIPFRF